MSEYKLYFKDKIDWKIYNYLLGKITKYEDIGNECYIGIYVKDSASDFRGYVKNTIFTYSLKYAGYGDGESDLSYLVDKYKKFGLIYSASVNNQYDYEELNNTIKIPEGYTKDTINTTIVLHKI